MIDIMQLDEISYKFTDLGIALSEMASQNKDYFDSMLNDIEGLKSLTDDMSSGLLSEMGSTLGGLINYAPVIAKLYSDNFKKSSDVFDSLNGAAADIKDVLNKAKEGAAAVGEPMEEALVPLPVPEGESETEREKQRGVLAGIRALPAREWQTVKRTTRGWMAKLRLPRPGTIIGGGFLLWMTLGFRRRDRIAAEAGEVKNILVSSFESTVEGALSRGTKYMSTLQETLHKSFGIARSEVQGVAKAFVAGGVSVDEMLVRTSSKLGKVGESFVTFTLGLDKMFDLPGGESAKRMVSLMSDYGKNMDEARQTLTKMMMVGKQSGIGTMQFMKNVQTAGDQLKSLGFDIEDVIDLADSLQEKFMAMGVPRQFAGRQAAIGLQQVAAGLVNMSDSWQVYMAERLGYEGRTPLERRQTMLESFRRVIRDNQREEFMSMIKGIADTALEFAKDDEPLARRIMESEMGLGFEGSKAAMLIKDALDKGDTLEAKRITNKNWDELKRSFTTEKSKQSQFQLELNRWLDAVGMIGQGLLGYVGNILAHLVAFGRSIPTLLMNWLSNDKEANVRLMAEMDKVIGSSKKHTDLMRAGFEKLKDAAQKMGLNIFSDSLNELKTAWNFDPSKGFPGTKSPVDLNPPASPFAGSAAAGAPMVQTVTIPAQDPGVYGMDPGEDMSSFGQPTPSGGLSKGGAAEGWVGGQLSIVSEGVDEQGNINLKLIGNCPRCGLSYGGALYDYEYYADRASMGEAGPTRRALDFEAANRMVTSEVGRKRLEKMTPEIRKEAESILWTALNRQRAKFAEGKTPTLRDVIVGKSGKYGQQAGEWRPYSTARKGSSEGAEIVQKVLGGEVADPTGGAEMFYHPQAFFRSKRGKKYDIPPYMKNRINTLNIGETRRGHPTVRFFAEEDMATAVEDPNRETYDRRAEKRLNKHMAKAQAEGTGVTQEPELAGEETDWPVLKPPEEPGVTETATTEESEFAEPDPDVTESV